MKTNPLILQPTHVRSLLALLAAGAFAIPAQAQQWERPYADGSAADLTLNFANGPTGAATSPNIPFAVGLSFNNTTPGIAVGGGWGLSAIGTAAVGVGIIIVGETHTQTQVDNVGLNFNMTTTGVSQIVGLSMTNQWSTTSGQIAGSASWTAPTNSYRYVFDAVLSSDILSLSPGLFNNFTLTIQAGVNILYQGGLNTILPSLVPSVTGATVYFDYDPATMGALSINWEADPLINTSILGALGNGTNLIYGVRNGYIEVDAVPEPGTWALMTGAAGFILLRRRWKRRG